MNLIWLILLLVLIGVAAWAIGQFVMDATLKRVLIVGLVIIAVVLIVWFVLAVLNASGVTDVTVPGPHRIVVP